MRLFVESLSGVTVRFAPHDGAGRYHPATVPADPFFFMQLSDPQLGLMAARGRVDPEVGFAPEVALFGQAVAEANRLKPDFVVVTGDLGQNHMDPIEIAEVKRIAAGLDPSISIYWAPGNADTTLNGETVRPELLERYRSEFGPDYYGFTHKGVGFIVLSSAVIYDPSEVPGEWEAQLAFVGTELSASAERGDSRRIVFAHHPLFTTVANDEDSPMHLPGARRRPLLELFREYDVAAVFSGHLHRNNYALDGDMLMIATSAVGMQIGDDKSGYRVVKVLQDRIDHDYYAFGSGPELVGLE